MISDAQVPASPRDRRANSSANNNLGAPLINESDYSDIESVVSVRSNRM